MFHSEKGQTSLLYQCDRWPNRRVPSRVRQGKRNVENISFLNMKNEKKTSTWRSLLLVGIAGALAPMVVEIIVTALYRLNMLTYKVSESAAHFIRDTLLGVDFGITLSGLMVEGCLGIKPSPAITTLTSSMVMAVIFILLWVFKRAVFRKAG